MSDTPQGEGWWEASDGLWYPPESVPGPDPASDPGLTQQWDRASDPSGPGNFQAPAPSPFEPPSSQPGGLPPGGPPPGYGAPPGPAPGYGAPPGPAPGYGAPPGQAPGYGAPAQGIPPAGPPPGFGPPGGQPPGYGGQAYGAPGQGGYVGGPPAAQKSSRTAWIILAGLVGVLVLVCGGCVALASFGANEASQGSGFEFISELGIDFTNGVPATGPVSCEVTGIQDDGDYAVDALVTNESGVTSHYRVDYDLFGPNQSYIGSDWGIVSNLEDGDSVRDFTVGTISDSFDWTDVTCEVTQTRRIEAE